MKYKAAIFDFDGTLADSFPFFMSVFNQLAEAHDFKKIDAELIPQYRHYSANEMLQVVGLPKWKLPVVGKSFMALMKQNTGSIKLFAGVSETLKYLHEQGICLAVVTSNSYENLELILGKDNIQLFDEVDCGMSIFGKASRLEKLLKKLGIAAAEAIYIGDQITDLQAARKADIDFGAVAWGYAAIEAFSAHNPEQVFQNVSDLNSIGKS